MTDREDGSRADESAGAAVRLLSEEARYVLRLVVLAATDARIELLADAADARLDDLDQCLTALEARGLVRRTGRGVYTADEPVREYVTERAGAVATRAGHRDLADAMARLRPRDVDDLTKRAHHERLAGYFDRSAASHVAAAEVHLRAGRSTAAVEQLRAAADIATSVPSRRDALRRAAHVATHEGVAAAGSLWAEVTRLSAALDDDEGYACGLYHLYWHDRDAAALGRLRHAASLGTERCGWSARAAACELTIQARYAEAVAFDERAIALARAAGDCWLEAVALEKLAVSRSYLGDTASSLRCMREAVALARSLDAHGWAVTGWLSLVDMLLEALETGEAVREARMIRDHVARHHLAPFAEVAAAYLALALGRAGELHEAVMLSTGAYGAMLREDANPYWFAVANIHAELLIEAGAITEAPPVLAAAERAAEQLDFASFSFEVRFARCRLRALQPDTDGVLELARDLDVAEPACMASVAMWAARLGATIPSAAFLTLAADVAATVTATGELSPLAASCIDEVKATTLGFDSGDVKSLVMVADRWGGAGRPLDQARALMSAAGVTACPDARRELLERALTHLQRCGAEAGAADCSARLRALGLVRTRRGAVSGIDPLLTPREVDVAKCIASGMRSADIACQLHISTNTVSKLVSTLYDKAGVRSRAGLANWMSSRPVAIHDS